MKPSSALNAHRAAVRDAVRRYRTNPRVFGSVLHGLDQEGSDLDLLVVQTALPILRDDLARVLQSVEPVR
jgi:predicted nucleotidyltransferase